MKANFECARRGFLRDEVFYLTFELPNKSTSAIKYLKLELVERLAFKAEGHVKYVEEAVDDKTINGFNV